jgi:hypothetical protein
MDDTRLPEKILFGAVAGGKKSAENLRRTGLTGWKRTVHRQTYPTVHGQKRRKIEPLGEKSISSLTSVRGNRIFQTSITFFKFLIKSLSNIILSPHPNPT